MACDLLKNIKTHKMKITDEGKLAQVDDFIDSFCQFMDELPYSSYRGNPIHPFDVYFEGDNVDIEWIYPDFRFCFVIETDAKDSFSIMAAKDEFGDVITESRLMQANDNMPASNDCFYGVIVKSDFE